MLAERLRDYCSTALRDDLVAGFIVAILLIPQSLAYALLAGLPPEVGVYASLLPMLAYAALRPTDIAFLHYRDAAFQIARAEQVNEQFRGGKVCRNCE